MKRSPVRGRVYSKGSIRGSFTKSLPHSDRWNWVMQIAVPTELSHAFVAACAKSQIPRSQVMAALMCLYCESEAVRAGVQYLSEKRPRLGYVTLKQAVANDTHYSRMLEPPVEAKRITASDVRKIVNQAKAAPGRNPPKEQK